MLILNKNRKGVFPIIAVVIMGLLALGIFGGWFAANKINTTIESIPDILWYGLIFLVVILMLPKNKK